MPKGKKHPSIQFDKVNWDLDDTSIINTSYVDHNWDYQPELLLYKTDISDFFNVIYDSDKIYGKLWEGKQIVCKLETIIEEWNSGKKLSPIKIIPRDDKMALINSGNHRFTVLYNAYKLNRLQVKDIFFLIPKKSCVCDEKDIAKNVEVDCSDWVCKNTNAKFIKTITI